MFLGQNFLEYTGFFYGQRIRNKNLEKVVVHFSSQYLFFFIYIHLKCIMIFCITFRASNGMSDVITRRCRRSCKKCLIFLEITLIHIIEKSSTISFNWIWEKKKKTFLITQVATGNQDLNFFQQKNLFFLRGGSLLISIESKNCSLQNSFKKLNALEQKSSILLVIYYF